VPCEGLSFFWGDGQISGTGKEEGRWNKEERRTKNGAGRKFRVLKLER
jgi:hypothetical protein